MRRSRRSEDEGLDVSVSAVVLKMVPDRYGHGRLGVIRSLGRLGVPVYALHESKRIPAARSRFSRQDIPWPIGEHPDAGALGTLVELGARIGGRPLLIATDDVGALFVDDHAEELRRWFRFPALPLGLVRRCADKYLLHDLCVEHGVPTPAVVVPDRRADLTRGLEELGLPVVVKAMDPEVLRTRPGASSVAIARSREELIDLFDRGEDWARPNLMLQEYIPGDATTVWMFNGYFAAGSTCRAAFTGQKLRQYPRSTGATTLGVTRDNPTVVAITERLMAGLGYQGICDMGYRFDARDGQYKLLDLNPRLGATFRLFVDVDGLDVVRAMYRDLTDQPVPPVQEYEGRRWWVEPFDLWTRRDYRREDGLRLRHWLRSVVQVDERAWFARDDLRPGLAMATVFAARGAARRLTRGRLVSAVRHRLVHRRQAHIEIDLTTAATEATSPEPTDGAGSKSGRRSPGATSATTVGATPPARAGSR